MAKTVSTFLMFDGHAEEAMQFYVSLFNGSAITSLEKYTAGEPGPEGRVKRADFTLRGHSMICIDTPVKHDFTFTPAISLFVECESEAELDKAFDQLSASGQVFVPPGDYGFSSKFAWVGDRFGVSWQLNLK